MKSSMCHFMGNDDWINAAWATNGYPKLA